jgi:hypothetical protein
VCVLVGVAWFACTCAVARTTNIRLPRVATHSHERQTHSQSRTRAVQSVAQTTCGFWFLESELQCNPIAAVPLHTVRTRHTRHLTSLALTTASTVWPICRNTAQSVLQIITFTFLAVRTHQTTLTPTQRLPRPLFSFRLWQGGCWTARAPLVGSVRGAGCASKRDVTVRPFSHGHCRVHQVTAIGWGEVVQGHQCQEEQGVQAPHPVGQAPPSPALVDFARVGCHILLSLTDCSAHRTFSSVHYLIYLHTHLLALACKLRWKCKNCIPSF